MHTSSLVVVGTPLLDLVVIDGEPLLEKYRLKSNDTILAGPEHSSMCATLNILHIRLLLPCLTPATKTYLRATNPSLYLEEMPILRAPLLCVRPPGLTCNNGGLNVSAVRPSRG